ncbi:hypothetical protein F2Q68_00031704 [Brassica cretica]|uniref:Uncharacterized protein n=1 Tax=Brassica cretica TaxID=69181 RepID=A0A8S9G8N6_BRACR|nr:hypothetical protein F2Q68_00031704 [Brassica cretica]
MVGGRRTRQTLRRRRGLFVALLPVVLSFRLIFTPAMSREDSLATAILRSSDSKADVSPSPSVRRQTSHSVHYVQAVQLLSERRYQTTNSSPSSPARLEYRGLLLFFKPASDLEASRTAVRFCSGEALPATSFMVPMNGPNPFLEPVRPTIYLQGPRSVEENLIRHVMSVGDWVSYAENSGGFTGFPPPRSTSLDFSCWKKLREGLPGSVLIRSYSSFEEKLLPPYLLSIERGVSSVSLLSVCFSFFIVLLSCVAVSTGSEDAIEITSVFLVDEIWTLTSHYVTILPLFDFVGKVPSTHSSTVLNSLSSSIEDLSCLVYLCAVSTGPEDANEITSIFLVDEVWTLTLHYVTILPLFDFVVKVPSTHSSTVLNSLSSSIEDLSCLVYLCVVCYVYGQRGWIIPSIYCSDEV